MMRLTREEYVERGMHKAVPTSLVDAIELGIRDAYVTARYHRNNRPDDRAVADFYDGLDCYDRDQIVADRVANLPDEVPFTPEDVAAAQTLVLKELGGPDESHRVFDAVLCLIAYKAGFGGFAAAFEEMPKWYS